MRTNFLAHPFFGIMGVFPFTTTISNFHMDFKYFRAQRVH
jgi:hypothetical protein